MSIIVFTDFDGTITKEDTLEMVLDRFAKQPWRDIEDQVTQHKMNEREALQAEFDLIRESYDTVLKFVEKHVQIDNTFISFADWCAENNTPLIVLSGGFEPFIETTFTKFAINTGIQFYANQIQVIESQWKIIPVKLPKIKDLCNHCKTHHLVAAKKEHDCIVYIGDGNTDRCPALQADVIFAKDNLAQYLTAHQRYFYYLDNFRQIQEQLQSYL